MASKHPRLPAFCILLAAVLIGLCYLSFSGRGSSAAASGGPQTLAQLEAALAANPSVETWFVYAEALRSGKRFAAAALAYRKVLEAQPYHAEARLNCATSLALEGQRDPLLAFLRDLVLRNAKLAKDIFERPELQPHLSDARFQALYKEARAQAMD